jgi:hypothetical protein
MNTIQVILHPFLVVTLLKATLLLLLIRKDHRLPTITAAKDLHLLRETRMSVENVPRLTMTPTTKVLILLSLRILTLALVITTRREIAVPMATIMATPPTLRLRHLPPLQRRIILAIHMPAPHLLLADVILRNLRIRMIPLELYRSVTMAGLLHQASLGQVPVLPMVAAAWVFKPY